MVKKHDMRSILLFPGVGSGQVGNVTTGSWQTSCNNATQTITVAGNDTAFQAGNGGNVALISGGVFIIPATASNEPANVFIFDLTGKLVCLKEVREVNEIPVSFS